MPAVRYYCRPIDTLEQKLLIERRLGSVRASKYFSLFRRFLGLKISKHEFDRLCIATIGRDVIPLHNHFVRSILKKASTPKTAPQTKSIADSSWKVETPNSHNDPQFLCKDIPQSSPQCRTQAFSGYPSPKIHEQQNSIELPPLSVEDDEKEVDHDLEILNNYTRSPIEAPLGIPTYNRSAPRISSQRLVSNTSDFGQLPDTCYLKKRLEQKLEKERLNISVDAVNLMDKALDVFLKRLIKRCLDLAASLPVHESSGPIQHGLNMP